MTKRSSRSKVAVELTQQTGSLRFCLEKIDAKRLTAFIKNQLPSFVGKSSLQYVAPFVEEIESNNQGRLMASIHITKKRPKIVPYLAIIALILSKLNYCQSIVVCLNLQQETSQQEIPDRVLKLLEQSIKLKQIVFQNFKSALKSSSIMVKLFQFLTINNSQIEILKIKVQDINLTRQVVKTSQNLSLKQLQIACIDFNQDELYQNFKNLNLHTLQKLTLSLVHHEKQAQNQMQNLRFCETLSLVPELSCLIIKIYSCLANQLVDAIGKLKYLDTFSMNNQPSASMVFSEENLLHLLKSNIYLSRFQIDFKPLSNAAKLLYRLIRQRKRIQQNQMLSIQAMQSVFEQIPLQHYMVANVLEMQKVVIL